MYLTMVYCENWVVVLLLSVEMDLGLLEIRKKNKIDLLMSWMWGKERLYM